MGRRRARACGAGRQSWACTTTELRVVRRSSCEMLSTAKPCGTRTTTLLLGRRHPTRASPCGTGSGSWASTTTIPAGRSGRSTHSRLLTRGGSSTGGINRGVSSGGGSPSRLPRRRALGRRGGSGARKRGVSPPGWVGVPPSHGRGRARRLAGALRRVRRAPALLLSRPTRATAERHR